MNHLLIYSPQTSPRLTYILDLILGELLGLTYTLTTSAEDFKTHTGPGFSYAPSPVADELFFCSTWLLFETDVRHQPIALAEYGNTIGFFPVGPPSLLPFDVFASAFHMVSRYIEYLPSKLDKYDRFRGSQSVIVKAGFVEKPMVNMYAVELRKILSAAFPALQFKKHRFTYIPTFDIDMAYSYLYKGFKRNAGGLVRDFFLSDFKLVRERLMVLMRGMKDPYDTYDYIFETLNSENLRPIFFFLLGDESRFDKNIPHTEENFQKLIKKIAAKADVGIHLSFKSHAHRKFELQEIKRLEEITGETVTRNRYHYLRFHVPNSYLRLIEEGVTDDYSMGYAPHAGFRAGICTPFYFFNLRANQVTPLRIHPIAFMDTTFAHYKKMNAKEAMERIRRIMRNVKDVEGTMYALWHNSSFTDQKEYKGWRSVFEKTTHEAASLMKPDEAA